MIERSRQRHGVSREQGGGAVNLSTAGGDAGSERPHRERSESEPRSDRLADGEAVRIAAQPQKSGVAASDMASAGSKAAEP